jgi:hypothetical protein
MSLDGFYRGLAAMAGDPDLARHSRAGDDGWLLAFDLTSIELDRLSIMARDDGMEVICSLYRANRLTALVNTVPSVVRALGDRMSATASEFWAVTPRVDIQFRTEAVAFCDFVSTRFPGDRALLAVVDSARAQLLDFYDTDPNDSSALEGHPRTSSERIECVWAVCG